MTIKKQGNEWCVFSKDGSKNLGCFPTKGEAEKRLREVEFFKKRVDTLEHAVRSTIKLKNRTMIVLKILALSILVAVIVDGPPVANWRKYVTSDKDFERIQKHLNKDDER